MSCSINAWIDTEFEGIDLADKRLNRRFKLIATQLMKRCGKTIASSFQQWNAIKACYRFFSNPNVLEEQMLAPHIEQTVNRAKAHKTVLLLQDTVYLDYNKRPGTAGLDLTFRSKKSTTSRGLMLHNTLAVSESGLPLGLIDQRFIDRKSLSGRDFEEKRQIRHWNAAVKDKESARWIDVLRKCHGLDFANTQTVHVADRECDMYEFFRDAVDLDEKVLIRAARNRSINKRYRREAPSCLLFDYLKSQRAQTKVTVTVQVNRKKKFRDAELSIVYIPISMPPPPNKTVRKDGPNLPMVPLFAIMAIERRPPANHNAILWVLLTNLEINSDSEAVEKVSWYARRWNIEVFHKVMKSGCAIEDAQLRHADRLKKYIVLKSIIAWRLFWLAREYEYNSNEPCTQILSDVEWTLLYRKTMKCKSLPPNPPTTAEVFIWIAKLGGYIARATDPPPGVVSLWRGWQRLMYMVEDFNDICG